jgi:hypothetical protein
MVSLNRVLIVDKGSPDYAWARGVLLTDPSQPEVFVYPDTDETLDPKCMVGSEASVIRVRKSDKPGPTKFCCNLAAPMFQCDPASDPFAPDKDIDEAKEPKGVNVKKRAMAVEWSPAREAAVDRVIQRYQLEGRFARSKALAYVIDEAIERGLA